MLQAFLFDFNATLIQSPTWMDLEIRSLPRQAFAHLARQGHISPLDDDQLARAEAIFRTARQTANTSLRETSHTQDLTAMVEALGLPQQISPQLIEETVASLHRQCVPTVELIEGADQMLRQLQALDYRLGIISNAAYGPFLSWALEQLGLLGYFEQIIVSADVGLRKPGLDIFHLTLDRMGLAPAQTTYVGDDFQKDVVASKEMGMRAVWYRPEVKAIQARDQSTPDAIVTHLDQIPPWARRWRALR
jgi:HAD superfamily hydrolase (TIGR01509 family)